MTTTAPANRGTGEPVGAPLLELHDVSKRFGGVRALRSARMTIARGGVVHGLMGANGSGKSTLLGILSGQLRPDSGSLTVDGEHVTLTGTRDALAHGIAMVSQETALAPSLSIAENVFLGRLSARRGTGIDWTTTNERAAGLLAGLGVHEDPRGPVGALPPDRQQLVEIARAISQDARILILDEPTSSLDEDEVHTLFSAVDRLRGRGVAIVFVSHRMDELLRLVDELTILRNGDTVAEGPIGEFDAHRIVDAMVGRDGAWTEPVRPSGTSPAPSRAPALRVRGLRVGDRVHGVDVDVAPGQIVGLAGIVGSGRHMTLEAIFGRVPMTAGEIAVDGTPIRVTSPITAIGAGIAYLPPDRKTDGLVLQQSVSHNLTAVINRRRRRLAPPHLARERALVEQWMRAVSIVAASPDAPVNTLSGGNQQKVALARWLVTEPRVFLLDEPTRGVDVAAKEDIHRLLRSAADRGMALLVSSSEPDELLRLCDVIVVLRSGRVAAAVPASEATEASIAHIAGGHQ